LYQVLRVSKQLWLQKVSVILWSYPNDITKPSVSVSFNLRCGDSVCLCFSCLVSTLKFKTMQCTAGTDLMDTARDKLRAPLAHLLYLLLDVFGCSLSITQLYGGPLHFMVVGTRYKHYSQLFSKGNMWNEKVAKELRSSKIAKQKFWIQLLLKRAKFLVFGSKRANLATLVWLQKSQSGNISAIRFAF